MRYGAAWSADASNSVYLELLRHGSYQAPGPISMDSPGLAGLGALDSTAEILFAKSIGHVNRRNALGHLVLPLRTGCSRK